VREKVDLAAKLAGFEEAFRPRIVGYYNDDKIQVAKVKGEFVWHSHPDTDDLFLVLSGSLTIELRAENVELGPGDLYVVPARRRAPPAVRRWRRDPPDRAGGHAEHRRLGSGAGARGRDLSRVKLVWFVPAEALEATRDAVFAAGAGAIGAYERCSWYTAGTGTFLGGEGTDPAVGEREREEHVPELRVEAVVPEEALDGVVTALRLAHPYEEPAYDVYPLLDA